VPTLREFLQVLYGEGHDIAALERRARERWPTEHVYIPQVKSRKVAQNLAVRSEIVQVAASQGIVRAARKFGVTPRTVRRLARRATEPNP
jgi:transposase-like protein